MHVRGGIFRSIVMVSLWLAALAFPIIATLIWFDANFRAGDCLGLIDQGFAVATTCAPQIDWANHINRCGIMLAILIESILVIGIIGHFRRWR